ncbi:MAG: YcxB family protein [Fusobacteriales bacterium]|nr:YcxB family protein [Fusobacteriales bacterium]
MNIEIKKLSFKDYVISRVEMEKVKLLISLGVIWAYVIYDMERKGNGAGLQTILKEYTLPALILSLGINIFVYLAVYFFSYKKALKESGVIKAQVTDNYLKNFCFFGDKSKQAMRKYSEFNKIYERRNGFYFNLIGRITFFIPKKGMTDEEVEYVSAVISKNNRANQTKPKKRK